MHDKNQDLIDLIAGKFSQVLPDSREKCLVVILLHLKIRDGFLEAEFSEGDFKRTMDEVEAMIVREKPVRLERPIRELVGYFLSYNRKTNTYRISQYGEDFVTLILQKVERTQSPTSLKQTFRSTLQLNDVDKESIEALAHWHENQFLATSKRTIESVLDGLEQEINVEFDALSASMNQQFEEIKPVLTEFQERFTNIRTKSDDIRETIEARQEVIETLKMLEEKFRVNPIDWERFADIDSSISRFFERIDQRLAGIYQLIDQAVRKLNLLYESFRYKRAHRIRLEQFVQFLFAESNQDENGKVQLPSLVSMKHLVSLNTKFNVLPADFELRKKAAPSIWVEIDQEELQLEREKQIQQLEKRQLSDQWTSQIESLILAATDSIEVSKLLYEIAQTAPYPEIVLNVASNILWRFGDRNGFVLEITPPTTIENSPQNWILWNMTITPLAS